MGHLYDKKAKNNMGWTMNIHYYRDIVKYL